MGLNSTGCLLRYARATRFQAKSTRYGQCIKLKSYSTTSGSITVNGKTYGTDNWTNIPQSILSLLHRKLYLQPSHPLAITRELIESSFPEPTYTHYRDLDPVVSIHENFDSLGIPKDHISRSRSHTYYINEDTVLRTHSSAHEAEIFRTCPTGGYTISGDVYRREAIDRSHYPAFHQVEGARMWKRPKTAKPDISDLVYADLTTLSRHDLNISDPSPSMDDARNPRQSQHHSVAEVEAISAHLKRSLELMVANIFQSAQKAQLAISGTSISQYDELKIRWVEAYFPFTSPSWELEVFWQNEWLEILGCGVTKQDLHINAGAQNQSGWTFGVGLERLAMLLFSIPDIRLFWSQDERFLRQFSTSNNLRLFAPFSKYPACYKDISFWTTPDPELADRSSVEVENRSTFHENEMMEIIRGIGGDTVEDVKLIDQFTHPSNGRQSRCYRINYRSFEKTLKNSEADAMHSQISDQMTDNLAIEIR